MGTHSWLLFFHTLPAKPVAARMKVWRRLARAGALHLKGSVYLLPHGEEHHELLTWLTQEIETLGGQADFVSVPRTATLASPDLVALFNQARGQAYRALQPEMEALQRALSAPPERLDQEALKRLAGQVRRLREQHRELSEVDFFGAAQGAELAQVLTSLEERLAALKTKGASESAKPVRPTVTSRRRQEYQGRLWVTRPRPFVDRMASAWLIRRFIDPQARFGFTAQDQPLPPGAVGFDRQGGEFSHLGDWCSFEVLIKAFGLKDKALRRLAGIVHEMDLRDGKFNAPQARGTEEILRGVLRTAQDDQEALEKGMNVLEMLYASLT
ncbi:MAG: chromate resistance protein [Desulfarculus sp.]|nr:chromate resistance protein [Desulfarculus sp.]